MFVHIHTRGDEAVSVEWSRLHGEYEITIGDAVVLLSNHQASLLACALVALMKQDSRVK